VSVPMIVVALLIQITGTWNDFILGLVFAGNDNRPVTVLLNNVVNSQFGEKQYNVNMAATILSALVPLVLYFVSGRWFVRGITAGALKG
jgi:glucose/mannose transport system permease protein